MVVRFGIGDKLTVVITGAAGMLGRSLIKEFRDVGRQDVVGISRADFDLRQGDRLRSFLREKGARTVIHCAAKVGGIADNVKNPVAYLEENLALDRSLIMSSLEVGVKDLIYIGSSCMYPKDLSRNLVETDLLAGALEPTNEGYALAKIVGSKLCEYISSQFDHNYRTIIASNLYGPEDNFSVESGHLVASVIRKSIDAKNSDADSIEVWGDGTARREFTYVGDLAKWLVSITDNISELPQYLNVGAGVDYSVDDYYTMAMECLGVNLKLRHDQSKPNGMRSKLMDSSNALNNHNWKPETSISAGISAVIDQLTRNAPC
jgi:GDP-L-fucose synthase